LVQSVFKNAKRFSLTLFSFYLFDVFVDIIPNFVAPNKAIVTTMNSFSSIFLVGNVRVFDVETTTLESLEKCFDLPSFLVIKQ